MAVDIRYSGAASGVNNAISRIAALLAIALLGAVMAFTFSSNLTKQITSSNLTAKEQYAILQQKDKIGAIQIPQIFSHNAKVTAQHAVQDSFLAAFRTVMGISAALAVFSSVLSFLFIRPPQTKE